MTYLITEEAHQAFENEMIDLMIEHMTSERAPVATGVAGSSVCSRSRAGKVYPSTIPILPSFSVARFLRKKIAAMKAAVWAPVEVR